MLFVFVTFMAVFLKTFIMPQCPQNYLHVQMLICVSDALDLKYCDKLTEVLQT